jgi:hypothetical protein
LNSLPVIGLNYGVLIPGDFFFAIAHDMGTIRATQAPIVWAIGYTTDPAINYANQSDFSESIRQRRPYYKSQYTDDESLVTLLIFEQVIASVLISWSRSLTF